MYSDDPNVIEYRTFYIRDLEAKLDAYRLDYRILVLPSCIVLEIK